MDSVPSARAKWCDETATCLIQTWALRCVEVGREDLGENDWADVACRVHSRFNNQYHVGQIEMKFHRLKKRFKREQLLIKAAREAGKDYSPTWSLYRVMETALSSARTTPRAAGTDRDMQLALNHSSSSGGRTANLESFGGSHDGNNPEMHNNPEVDYAFIGGVHGDQEAMHDVHGDQEAMHDVRGDQEAMHDVHGDQEAMHDGHGDQEAMHDVHGDQEAMHDVHGDQEAMHDGHGDQEAMPGNDGKNVDLLDEILSFREEYQKSEGVKLQLLDNLNQTVSQVLEAILKRP